MALVLSDKGTKPLETGADPFGGGGGIKDQECEAKSPLRRGPGPAQGVWKLSGFLMLPRAI